MRLTLINGLSVKFKLLIKFKFYDFVSINVAHHEPQEKTFNSNLFKGTKLSSALFGWESPLVKNQVSDFKPIERKASSTIVRKFDYTLMLQILQNGCFSSIPKSLLE